MRFLLGFFILTSVFGLKNSPKTPKSAASIAEEARELVLKNERPKAIKLLRDLYRERGGKVSKATHDVVKTWEEIANVFVTDKGQSQFSLAESVWMTKPKEAIDTLSGVLKLEDGNVQVAVLGGRAALRAQDCSRAETFQLAAEAAFPMGMETQLLKLQVLDCQNGSSSSAPAIKLTAEGEWLALDSAVRELAVRDAIRRKEHKLAQAALTAWETQSGAAGTDNPELWYWKWKLATGDRSAARKYLKLCAEMTQRRRKNFSMHPELCLHTESVESDLKSSEKSGA